MKIKTTGYFKNHVWWYKVGAVYDVKEYQYLATEDAKINSCYCSDCQRERGGKRLYKMYQDIKTGSIIPVKFCIPVNAQGEPFEIKKPFSYSPGDMALKVMEIASAKGWTTNDKLLDGSSTTSIENLDIWKLKYLLRHRLKIWIFGN